MMSWSCQADPKDFLGSSRVIDHEAPEVRKQALGLLETPGEDPENCPRLIARRCFEFVRDEIKHSSDYQLNPVTLTASDTLLHRTGYCFAKSHLLCALLRANGIPAGLCYQRLTVQENRPPYCLHGLNAIYLPTIGWYRVDCRGNRADVDAQFTPPDEQLAFPVTVEGECDLPGVYSDPIPEVLRCLDPKKTWDQILTQLPDVTP